MDTDLVSRQIKQQNNLQLAMSDHADRRRNRRGGGGSTGPRRGNNNHRENSRRHERDSDRDTPTPPAPVVASRPIILTKPSSEKRENSQSQEASMKQVDNAIIMVKARDDPKTLLKNTQTSISPSDYRLQKIQSLNSPSPVALAQDGLSPQLRLALPVPMSQPVKLMDENLHWCDAGVDFLLDQTDYIVIGAVGLQGAGKSTILSMLAGSSVDDSERIFKPASVEKLTSSSHQTSGVDMYVISNRIIFLDAQPVLSPSVLDIYNRQDRKFSSNDFTTAENHNEIQSLQLTAFLYTVCNVVLVVQNWFADPYFLKFLTTAEMLRPSIPSSAESAQNVDHQDEFVPHLIFVQNKAKRADFTTDSMKMMTDTLSKCFEKSKLRYHGGVSMTTTNLFPNLTPKSVPSDVNLYLLPWIQDEDKDPDPFSVLMPEYKGYPPFEELMRVLRNQVFQLPRQPFTHTPLTERNWFHFAARIWEGIKKSQLFSEYSRLLP